MSYSKTTWENGDVITAEKLNHAENGIAAAAPVIVTFVYEDEQEHLSMKAGEIADALANGLMVYLHDTDAEHGTQLKQIVRCEIDSGSYKFLTAVDGVNFLEKEAYIANSINDYPVYDSDVGIQFQSRLVCILHVDGETLYQSYEDIRRAWQNKAQSVYLTLYSGTPKNNDYMLCPLCGYGVNNGTYYAMFYNPVLGSTIRFEASSSTDPLTIVQSL